MNITYRKSKNKIEAYNNQEKIAECEFLETDTTIDIIHTVVNENYRGMHLGKELIKQVIADFKEKNKQLIGTCSYAKKILETETKSTDKR